MRHDLKAAIVTGLLVAAAFSSGCTQDSPSELLQEANAALAKGELKTAEIHLKNLLQTEEGDAQARLLLARTYAAGRDWQSAEKEFLRALELGANPALAAPGLLEAMYNAQDAAKVIEQAGKLDIADAQAKGEVAVWTARAWMKRGDADKARLAFEDALRHVPGLLTAQVGLLALQARKGADARTQALAAIAAILKESPTSQDALMLQAELRLAAGDLKGARAPLEAVVAASLSDLVARSTLIEIDLALKDREAARIHLAELLKRAPKWPVALTQMAQLHLLDGQMELARDRALEALKLAADHYPALAVAGSTLLAQGSFEQAESYARQMIKIAPALTNGHRLLAATLLKRGEPGRALQVVEPLLQDDEGDAQLLVIAGEAALRDGNAAASAKYFEKATALDRQDAGKRVGLALARLGSGDRAGGLADLQAATSLDSESSTADQILVATLISERRFDQALEAIARLEKKQPGSGEVQFLKGRAALAQGDALRARSYFEQALLISPSMLHAAASLAALDVKDGKAEEGRKRFEALVKGNPKSAPALLALAKLTADTGGKPEEILQLLQRAHEAAPDNEAAALALAEKLVSQGRAKEAVQVLQSVAKRHPGWLRTQEALAMTHIRAGEPDRANDIVDKLARLKPDDAALQFRMGTLKTTLKDYHGALQRYQRVQVLRPEAIEPRANVALTQARLGRLEDAFATAKQLQKDFTRNSIGWSLEGEMHRARQQWQKAAESFRKALDVDPMQRAHALKLHDSLLRAGSNHEAARLLQGWLKASPRDEKLNLYAGERELANKRYAEAVRHYDIAVAENPKNGAAHNNLAWALHQIKDPRALPAGEEAYRLAPNSAAVADTLASILVDNNQTQRGLALHKRAAELAPQSADFRLKHATALKSSGNKVDAKRELDQVVRDFPGTPQASTAATLSAELGAP